MLSADEITKLQSECAYFQQIVLDYELEHLWHAYAYQGDTVEGIAEFETRIHDLSHELQLSSDSKGGYPDSVIQRVVDVETETRNLICSHDAYAGLTIPPAMRVSAHRTTWACDRIRAGCNLVWSRGVTIAVAQFIATLRIAEVSPEEQVSQLSRFFAECEYMCQASPSTESRSDRMSAPDGLYFTEPETPGMSKEIGSGVEAEVPPSRGRE